MESNIEELSSWLMRVLRALVSNPDDVKIESREDEMGWLFTVKVHEDDVAMVIGKQGTNAEALRTLLRIVGGKYDVRASMKIDAPRLDR